MNKKNWGKKNRVVGPIWYMVMNKKIQNKGK